MDPGRRDALAFWLGMTALLLSLIPLIVALCAMNHWITIDWILSWRDWIAVAVVVLPIAALVVAGASLLAKPNWRAGAAIIYAGFSLLAVLALAVLLAHAPDR